MMVLCTPHASNINMYETEIRRHCVIIGLYCVYYMRRMHNHVTLLY